MVWPMFAIGYLFNILERGSASYDRVEKLLDEKPAITDQNADQSIHAQDIDGDLKYEVKSFAYPDEPQIPVLHNIDFTLKTGQTLGLVGKVGAGKTTIIQLLLREFDQYDGKITLNGHDIREIPLNVLLRQISYVPQNNYLFSTSIQKNIAFSDANSDESAVISAAKKSDLHNDILQMPGGYNTLINFDNHFRGTTIIWLSLLVAQANMGWSGRTRTEVALEIISAFYGNGSHFLSTPPNR